MSLKDELFAPQVQEAVPSSETLCSKPMSKMSNYHEFMSKFAPLKNPHEEDAERRSYKEAIPFGNPFKYVVRSKTSQITDNYEDQAFLTSFNQLPLVERNKSERGVSPRGPQKVSYDPQKEKHRLSIQNFSLRSLQNALEESSGRSTPNSPGSLSTNSTSNIYAVPQLEEIKGWTAGTQQNKREEIAKKTEESKMDTQERKEKEEELEKTTVKPVEKRQGRLKEKIQKARQVEKTRNKVNPYYFMVCNATGKLISHI